MPLENANPNNPQPPSAALNLLQESHGLLPALIENLPSGAVFVVDRDLRYLLAQGEALCAAGFKSEDFVGRTIFEVLPPELARNDEKFYRQVLAGEPFESEHNSHNRWYRTRGTPLRSPNGDVYAVLAISFDITEHQQAEAALRESEAKYRLLFNSMDEAYAVVEVLADDNGEWNDFLFVEVNPAFMKQTSMEYPVGRKATELLGTPNPHWAQVYGRVAETGEPIRFEEGEATLGRVFDLYVFRLGEDGSRRVAVLFTDITDRKRTEEALRESEEQQAFLLKFSDALRAEPDADAVANRAIRMLSEQMQLDRCYIGVYRLADDRGDFTHQVGNDRVPPLPDGVRLSDFPESLRVAFDGTLAINDIAEIEGLSDTDRQNLSGLGLRALVAATLSKGENNPLWSIVSVSAHPRRWTQGEIALVEEVTERTWAAMERARVEAALRENEQRLSVVFAQAAVGLSEISLDGHFEQVNDALCRILGRSRSDLLATSVHEVTHPDSRPTSIQALHQVMETGKSVSLDKQYLRSDGTPIWANSILTRLDDDQGHPRSILAVTVDLSDRKLAETERLQRIQEQAAHEEERQRAESLAEIDRAKTLFFSNISHEFRTPLTLLLGPLQDALGDRTFPLAPVHRERLELARRNSLRLLKLVNTLLDFSRIEAGRIEAVYEPTDLAQFTAELASVFRSAIEQAGLRLIVDCPPLPEPVYIDREMWEKIVLNLLSNALKFTFSGEITVSLHPNDKHQAILQIQDTGSGIPPEHLPHLFERFYQVRGVQARTDEGSGIGLALVHELVQLQGGAIAVSSTLGQKTCFTISLPLGTAHLPSKRIQTTPTLTSTALSADPYVQEALRWLPKDSDPPKFPLQGTLTEFSPLLKGRGESPEVQADAISSARVLIVDDNADMREYLTRILSEYVQVEAVADGELALSAIQAQLPDLVLSDVMMPKLDGFSLLQTLRAAPHTREIPVILLSARAGEEAIAEGLEAGADDYLIKPFSAQELLSRVNAHLQISHLRGAALHEARTTIRRKDELLSVVSHELNTPLVSILGWTRLVRSNPQNPAMLSTALESIERSAMVQAKLVQDLLDVSRIAASKLRLHLQPTELESVIEAAIATVTQIAAAEGIQLIWIETAAAVVMADRERLQQVVCNLLSNAIKFTPTGGRVEVHLSLVTDSAGDEQALTHDTGQTTAEIRVTDTGIGIAPDFLPQVFEQFRQAGGTNSAKGLGLGLAISHHIVELHNGTIQAHSAGEGQGATLIVKLPLVQCDR